MEKYISQQRKLPDLVLLLIVLGLVVIGLAMVYSSSHVWAEYKYADALFFVKRQSLFAGVGVVCMFVIAAIPYYFWRKYVWHILIICLLFLILVLVPGIGIVRGGARSWIGIGAFSIQPSEFMKLGLIIFLSHYLSTITKSKRPLVHGFLIPISYVFVAFGLIMIQPDLGTGVVLVITTILMIFIAGANVKYFNYLAIIGLAGFAYLIISAPYRISRITSYLDPWEDPRGDGFQIIQSLYAIGPGKLMGVGYGNSLQKYFYLPEPQTDFIFAIIGEEFGFFGGAFLIIMFIILCWRGFYISLHTRDYFGKFIAFGIITMIIVQVMINISVVIGLIPVTGITLPFLSYGGSSLTLTLCSVGILLNISTYSNH